MSKIDNAQNLEVLRNVRQNGVTPGEFPNSGIKYIEAADGTKIIAEPASDHGNIIDKHTGELIAGRLRVVNKNKQFADIENDIVTTKL